MALLAFYILMPWASRTVAQYPLQSGTSMTLRTCFGKSHAMELGKLFEILHVAFMVSPFKELPLSLFRRDLECGQEMF